MLAFFDLGAAALAFLYLPGNVVGAFCANTCDDI
jgi:hypothetical protein